MYAHSVSNILPISEGKGERKTVLIKYSPIFYSIINNCVAYHLRSTGKHHDNSAKLGRTVALPRGLILEATTLKINGSFWGISWLEFNIDNFHFH